MFNLFLTSASFLYHLKIFSRSIEREHWLYKSSHRRCSIRKDGLQLYWRRDSGAGVFLWILWTFLEHLFYRTPLIVLDWLRSFWINVIRHGDAMLPNWGYTSVIFVRFFHKKFTSQRFFCAHGIANDTLLPLTFLQKKSFNLPRLLLVF